MAIGDGSQAAVRSYVAVAKETAFGTYATCTTAVEVISCGFRTNIKTMKLDTLSTNRGSSRRVQLDKEVAGTIETYAHPVESPLIFGAALGGSITSTIVSTGVYSHVFEAGNFTNTLASLSFNVRKGDTQVWQYQGGRVNSLKLTANVGEPLKLSADFVFKDSSTLTNDVSAVLSLTSYIPWTFVHGTFTYSATAQKVTGFELSIDNGLKSDKDARALGQNTLVVLPATRREIGFKITQRFDTTATWASFMEMTSGAVQLVFTSTDSLSSSNFPKLTIDMPKVGMRSPDPELKGSGDIIMSDIEYDVMVDNPMTSTGYDIKFTVVNNVALY
jgi:hypothetical protein